MALRKLLKFFHTMGAAGLLGAMAALLVIASVAPPPSRLAPYAAAREAMAAICTYMFLPSLGLSLVAGLLSIAFNRAFHNAGWAWAKLISGVLIFEGGLQGIQGPMKEEATQAAAALAGKVDPATLSASFGSERGTLWVLLAVATANVVLGVWRPKLTRVPD